MLASIRHVHPVLRASNTYKYDKAGNRTQWVTNKAPDTGKALTVNASYNGAGQLVSESKTRPALLGSSTVSTAYSYDANGNRTKSQTGLASTTYKYTDDDKLAEVNQVGRKVTTGYDGMGRALKSTTSSLLILSSTTTQVWDGYDVVQQSTGSVTTNLVRDVTGDVAIQTTPGLLGATTQWGLTDRLGSTIAQTSGSRVAQLAKYSDWGVPTFTSVGYSSRTGYTGELADTTAGVNHYYARSYEPTSASWLTADPYRGELDDPASLNRYAYVVGNPATLTDAYGYCYQNYSTGRYEGSGCGSRAQSERSRSGSFPVSPPASSATTPSGNRDRATDRHPDLVCPMSYVRCSASQFWGEIALMTAQYAAIALALKGRGGTTTRPGVPPKVPVMAPRPPAVMIGSKIAGQMSSRGWTEPMIHDTVANPAATYKVWDFTTGKEPATVYLRPDRSYVVVNDESGAVVQVSGRNDPEWKPVWEEPRFLR